MKLLVRVNLLLAGVFAVGGIGTAAVSYALLMNSARDQQLAEARLMMESALAVRNYTATEISPLLHDQLEVEFRPQSVPSYSAVTNLAHLRAGRPEYTYKEATLNPTNPTDRATDWEVDIVQAFRNDPQKTEIVGIRDTAMGRSMYLARPLRVDEPTCLQCHSTAAAAPATMVAKYGANNGFGWQLNEVVGSQIVSVPVEAAYRRAADSLLAFLLSLGAIFVVLFAALNWALRRTVVRPLERMAEIADRVSAGDLGAPEFETQTTQELSKLGVSFSRMRRSLAKSIAMLGA